MMRPTFLAAAALFVAQNALAAENVVLRYESPEGLWDFDMASVVIVNDSVRKSQISLKLKRPLQDQPTGTVYDRVVFHYEHDCKANRMRVVDSLSYLRGEPVKTSRANDDWHPAADSTAQQHACALVMK
ncbi:MAG TPA: surface-adhesin E family protein [Burkholderiales bacterium]|nr:surface-adhesin E family protein [Burkholderiales bacterium]